MVKMIPFSGAHSTGKSTVLAAIDELKLDRVFVERRSASREAQAKMKLPDLASALVDPVTMRTFQETVLEVKRGHEKDLMDNDYKVVFFDRSPADIFAYTYMWNEKFKNPLWFQNYVESLLKLMSNYYKIVNFPIVDAVPFVPEPGRADIDTRQQHAELVDTFLTKFAPRETYHLSSITVEDRVQEILKLI